MGSLIQEKYESDMINVPKNELFKKKHMHSFGSHLTKKNVLTRKDPASALLLVHEGRGGLHC
jgi:hypothetical protein